MASDTSKNLGVYYDGETSGTKGYASMLNAKDMALMTNGSGGSLTTGDVVVQDSSAAETVTTTTTAGDLRPVFVVPANVTGNDTSATKTVAASEDAWLYKPGAYVPAVTVDGAVDIGEYLTTSSTAKKLTGSGVTVGATTARPSGACAIALEAATGAGSIKAVLLAVTEAFGIADKTEKTTAVSDDLLLIADSAASNAIKKAKVSALKAILNAPDYDSGWFAVSTDTTYTKAHGLGAIPRMVIVAWSSSSSGTTWSMPSYLKGSTDQPYGLKVDATNVAARTNNDGTRGTMYDRLQESASGYYRILAWL